jgi:hypothetical protein
MDESMMREPEKLPALLTKASMILGSAINAGKILEAHKLAGAVYDMAKAAARFADKKEAHDHIIMSCRQAQADALIIQSRAQCRLADEYDAAQANGEIKSHGGHKPKEVSDVETSFSPDDLGLTSKQIHEARRVRDAEKARPGVIRDMLNERVRSSKEPTRASINRAVGEVVGPTPRKEKPRPVPVVDRATLTLIEATRLKIESEACRRIGETVAGVDFDAIKRCLRPDTRGSVSDPELSAALDAVTTLERRLLDESKDDADHEPSRAQVQRAVKETVSPNTDGRDAATVIKQLTKMVAAIPSPGLRKQVQNLLLDVSIVDKKNGHQSELEALMLEINRATLRLEDCSDRLRETSARDELTDTEKINYLENRLAKANNTIGTLKGQLAERDATIKVLKKELEKARIGAVKALKKQAERTKLVERDYLREEREPPWEPEVQKLHNLIHGANSSSTDLNPVQTLGSFLEVVEQIQDHLATKAIENKEETGVSNTPVPDPEKQRSAD